MSSTPKKKNYSSTFYVFNLNQVEPKTKVSWVPPYNNTDEEPYNVQSGTIYTKNNLLKLKATNIWKSGDDNRFYWSTFQGWSRLGYRVKSGEHGVQLYKNDPNFRWDDDTNFHERASNIKG